MTRLADVIVPEVFNRYLTRDTTTKSSIFESGIFRSDPMLSKFLAGGGLTVNVPIWNDLDDSDPDIASDDPEIEATPGNVDASKERAIRNIRTKGWQASDLTAELAGDDPMQRILSRVSMYWRRAYQRHLVKTLTGVFADNIANDSGDMVYDIGSDSASATTSAELVSAEAILDAAQTMGDNSDVLDIIIMHSVVYTRLAKQNLIDFIPNSAGNVKFPTYLGYRVVKDDNCRKVAGSNRIEYWTYLIGQGAIAWGEASVEIPVETYRLPNRGNGMGVEQLWTRRQYIMHPYGFDWTDTARAGKFPTNDEAATSSNWNRIAAERKQVRLALLITNG